MKKPMTQQQYNKEMQRLSGLLAKYAHRWSDSASNRMLGWVDSYDDLRREHRDLFLNYCIENRLALDHNGYDCLA